MQKRYKVLYIDTPLDPFGGGQVSLLLLLKYIDKEKFAPVVFIHKTGSMEEELKEYNISYKVVPLFLLFQEIKKCSPKIIHCNSPTTKYTFFSTVTAKMLKIPFIWHCRVVDKATWRDKIIFALSNRVVVTSESVKKRFINFYHQDKIVKIYNGVDIDMFKPGIDITKLKKEFNLHDEYIFGTIGRFDKWKGYEYFIDMAKILVEQIPNSKFFLVGDGDEKENLMLKVKNLRLGNKFFFPGWRKNIAEFISLFDVLVIPTSTEEPFGRTAIEAMSCGKPVVATNSGGLAEIIDNKITGILVEPKSAKALAEACVWLVQNKDKAKEIAEKARQKVEKVFSHKQYVGDIINLYEEFINKM